MTNQTTTTHRTRVFILNQSGQFLALIRNFKDKTGKHSPVVLLPGGGVDEGESSKEAMLREVQEELGLRLVQVKLLHVYKDTRPVTASEKFYWPGATYVTNLFDFYEARVEGSAKPVLLEPEKFDDWQWLYPKELSGYAQKHHAEIGDGIEEVIRLSPTLKLAVEALPCKAQQPQWVSWI